MAGMKAEETEISEPIVKESNPSRAADESGYDHTPGRRRLSRKSLTAVGALAVAVLLISTIWVIPDLLRKEAVIVAILPLSGASSYLVEIEDAMTMTAEILNKWGGINGMRIRLIVEDCESSPEVAVQKLLDAEEKYHPLAIVTATRDAAVPMAEIAEEMGVVLISIGASPETITNDKDWVFRYYLTSSGEVRVAMETIETLDITTLGILHLDDAYGTPIKEMLSEAFEDQGGMVVASSISANQIEFSDGIGNISDTEAVFVVGLRHQFPEILAELNASGYEGHFIGAVEASIPENWELPDSQGAYVSAPLLYNPGAAVDVVFLTEFEEKFGRKLTHQGAIGSDVLGLIWGLLSDRDVSRESLQDLMGAGFVHSGILGVVTLTHGNHNVDVPLFRGVIQGGGLQYLSG